MKVTIVEGPFGVLAFDDQNRLIEKALFDKKPQSAAKAVMKIEGGKVTEEIKQLFKTLADRGCDIFVLENEGLADSVRRALNVNVEPSKSTMAGEAFRSNTEGYAIETGFAKNVEEFSRWMHDVTVEIAKLKVKGAVERRDLVVGQAILALDDLDRIINLIMSHVREWYGIHFPELDRHLDKHETYCRLVIELGNRENFTPENLTKKDLPVAKAESIAKAAEASMGADLVEPDLRQIQALCKSVLEQYDLRQGLEKYLDDTMGEVAPNIKHLVGSLLGARLIAIAGGLLNVAKLPASTIQVLGAEKALFRSLKTGTRPPKHGIIFQHTYIHDGKRWQRGKIARALAGKLAIAARTDAFGERDIGVQLKADLDKRVDEIREKYSEPPPVPEWKPKPERPREERRGREDRRHERHGRDNRKWRKRRRDS